MAAAPRGWGATLAMACGFTIVSVGAAPGGRPVGHCNPAPVGPVVVVTLGDSTTAPRRGIVVYADLLAGMLADEGIAARVVNAGKGRGTTAGALRRLEADVLSHRPSVVVVQFGINDSMVDVNATPPAAGPRVPLPEFEANLREIVREVRRAGASVVLMTPNAMAWTPAWRERYGRPPYQPADPDGLNIVLRRHAAVVRTVALELQVPLVDILAAHDEHARRSRDPLLLDGMHPNQAGHDLVAERLAPVVAKQFPAHAGDERR